jgi:hypothetical protein
MARLLFALSVLLACTSGQAWPQSASTRIADLRIRSLLRTIVKMPAKTFEGELNVTWDRSLGKLEIAKFVRSESTAPDLKRRIAILTCDENGQVTPSHWTLFPPPRNQRSKIFALVFEYLARSPLGYTDFDVELSREASDLYWSAWVWPQPAVPDGFFTLLIRKVEDAWTIETKPDP